MVGLLDLTIRVCAHLCRLDCFAFGCFVYVVFYYTPKLDPHPQLSSALGLKNLNPPPISSSE